MAWEPDLMTAFLLSHGMIALAYLGIALSLVVKAHRPGPVIPRWLYGTYATFIFCFGVSHLLDGVTLWYPVYRLQALVLGVTAMVSVFTAVLPVSIWVKKEIERQR